MASSPFLAALGGTTVGAATVKLVLDAKAYQAQMASAKGETEASLAGMGSSASKFSMYATAAFAAVGVALVAFADKAIQAASAHEQVLTQLTLSFGDNTQAIQTNAEQMQSLTGYSQDQVMAADAVLGRLHLTTQQVAALNPFVTDLASVLGVDLPTAAGFAEKAILGTGRGLKNAGIDFTDTGSKIGNLNELLSLYAGWTMKGAASADTAAKSQRELSASFQQLEIEVGQNLLPIVKSFAGEIAKIPTPVLTNTIAITALGAASFGAAKLIAFLAGAFTETEIAAAALAAPLTILAGLVYGVARAGLYLSDRFTQGPIAAIEDLTRQSIPTMIEALRSGKASFADVQTVIDKSNAALKGNGSAFRFNAQAVKYAAKNHVSYDEALQHVTSTTQGETTATNAEARAHDKAAAAAKAQKTAEDQLAGGLLGLIASANAVTADQKQLNDLRAKGKTTGAQYHAVELQLLQDSASETSNLQQYIQTLKQSGDSQHTAIDLVANLGRQFGVTRGDVRALVGEVYNLNGALARIPTNVSTTVQTTYTSTGGGGHRRLASGGVIAAQAGMITRGPTYLTGEGGYPTAFGRGSEAVIPLTDATMDRLGEAIAKHSKGGTVNNISVRGQLTSVHDLQRELDWALRSRGV